MIKSFNIDLSAEGAKDFLQFIKNLDYVSENEEISLTEEQKKILDSREKKYLDGETKLYSWKEVKESLRKNK